MTTVRTDIHRPSAINAEEYQFVGIVFDPGADDVVGGHQVMAQEQEIIRQFMQDHGARWASHEHGGTCQCCGAHAAYLAAFYHEHHNEMIRVGERCAEKIGLACKSAFDSARRKVASAREYATGKARAHLQLEEANLLRAWDIYVANDTSGTDETIVIDMVRKLISYGSLSDKQIEFMRRLVDRIDNREAYLAQKETEKAAAKECPTGRMEIRGTIISIKEVTGYYGDALKMLVKTVDGYTVYGTIPRGLDAEKGAEVIFTATITPSDRDSKHGYFSRPSAQKK